MKIIKIFEKRPKCRTIDTIIIYRKYNAFMVIEPLFLHGKDWNTNIIITCIIKKNAQIITMQWIKKNR